MAASWPLRTSWRLTSTTCFCAPPKVSSLMMKSTRTAHLRLADSAVHPPLPPHLEGEQVPELLRIEAIVAGTAVAEIGHRARNQPRIEKTPLANAPRGEVFGDE